MDKVRVAIAGNSFFGVLDRTHSMKEAMSSLNVREMTMEEFGELLGVPMESVELSEYTDAPGGSDDLSDWIDIPEEFEGGDAM